jgi:hypothetical protein
MKKTMFAVLAGAALCVAGCVSTVTEQTPGRMPAYRDRSERRYDYPLDKVYEAAKRAVTSYGNITKEGSWYTSTNEVRILEASINQRGVWMRLESMSPSATLVLTQVRAKMGGTDLDLAHEVEDRIAFELKP